MTARTRAHRQFRRGRFNTFRERFGGGRRQSSTTVGLLGLGLVLVELLEIVRVVGLVTHERRRGHFFQLRYIIAGENSIQVYGADATHFFTQQVYKQSQVEFCIKQFPFLKETVQAFLLIAFFYEWHSVLPAPANQYYFVTCMAERSTYPLHPLIITEVVGNSEIYCW